MKTKIPVVVAEEDSVAEVDRDLARTVHHSQMVLIPLVMMVIVIALLVLVAATLAMVEVVVLEEEAVLAMKLAGKPHFDLMLVCF